MKKRKRNLLKNRKGITLIALVVIIIVLIILAGVSISLILGENGIITKSKYGKRVSLNAEVEEQEQLNEAVEYLGNMGSEGTNVKGDISGANPPVLKDGMQAISFASDGTEIIIEDTSKNDWYSYEIQSGRTDTYNEETGEWGTSHWANAKLDENYYVWIPRYAYKIDKSVEYTNSQGKSYKIDIIFLRKDNKRADGTEVEGLITDYSEITETKNSTTNYVLHPAFTFGEQVLSGIWVGKFETSGSGSDGYKIVPNANSATEMGDYMDYVFSNVQKLGEGKTNLDIHLTKNTDWGAVVYLAQSQYGRNGTEISPNTGAYTGNGKNEGTTEEQQYNGKIGKLSSTTGNVYGIYDIEGGWYEYIMGIRGQKEAQTIPIGMNQLVIDKKYADIYPNEKADITNIGDAVYETLNWNSTRTGDLTLWGYKGSSAWIFKRGGQFSNIDFGYSGTEIAGFRVSLVVNE